MPGTPSKALRRVQKLIEATDELRSAALVATPDWCLTERYATKHETAIAWTAVRRGVDALAEKLDALRDLLDQRVGGGNCVERVRGILDEDDEDDAADSDGPADFEFDPRLPPGPDGIPF